MTEKLVRDLIPQFIAAKGESVPPWRILSEVDRIPFLLAKMKEELSEFLTAFRDAMPAIEKKSVDFEDWNDAAKKVVAEAADLTEVLYSLVDEDQVRQAREAKRKERGGFDLGVVMEFGAKVSHEEGCKGMCRGCEP